MIFKVSSVSNLLNVCIWQVLLSQMKSNWLFGYRHLAKLCTFACYLTGILLSCFFKNSTNLWLKYFLILHWTPNSVFNILSSIHVSLAVSLVFVSLFQWTFFLDLLLTIPIARFKFLFKLSYSCCWLSLYSKSSNFLVKSAIWFY